MGVSIFLNRYIGNIPQSARCIEIEKTEPLRFIDLIMIKNIGQINTCPELAYKIYKNSGKIYQNYHPQLIILIGRVIFLHVYSFLMSEYPRYVPSYTIELWYKS